MAGPFHLRQGGDGIIGRLPVFLTDAAGQDRFWGFTIMLIRLPRILAAAQFERREEAGYYCELWRSNPDTGRQQIIMNSRNPLVGAPVTTAVDVPNGQRMLSLTPARGWYSGTRIAIGTAVAAVLTAVFAAMLNAYLRNRQRWGAAPKATDACSTTFRRPCTSARLMPVCWPSIRRLPAYTDARRNGLSDAR